ncbi:Multidrug resistance-associated protein [Nesidiocoris tenuis]|uniref:Multidrug resistance-associated protein n=1 Tax=Nesidiocoris tenuis TaxID=355587 RepID=A0ABN7AD52_9HEMI|nr:Multidrug resistance-associated protein [Nesidiocoris tenuis]
MADIRSQSLLANHLDSCTDSNLPHVGRQIAELKYVKKSNFIRGLYMAFNLSTTKFALVLTLSAYILSGYTLTTAEVFVIGSYYSILNHTMASVFVRGIQETAECSVSLKRLQAFLLREEVDPTASQEEISSDDEAVQDDPSEDTPLKAGEKPNDNDEFVKLKNEKNSDIGLQKITNGNITDQSARKSSRTGQKDVAVVLQDVRASWVPDRMVPTLMNLTLSIKSGELIGLIGSVGSGKSSLLHLLMSELKHEKGKVFVNGTLSYASQEPWIFSGTIRDNILLGQPYDKKRYAKVVWAACLKRDFELFSDGDKTDVGERGASLSGGQKARISLARAIYRDADIYLLDDPLSAVDAHVAKAMFLNCFRGFLKDKTVILATHQLQFLDQVDQIIFLQVGQVKDMGNFEDLMKRGHDFTKIVEESQASSEQPVEIIKTPPEGLLGRRISESDVGSMMGSMMGSVMSIVKAADGTEEETEPLENKNEAYEGNVFMDYLRSGKAVWVFGLFLFFQALAQFLASFSDYWIAIWAKSFDRRKIQVNSTDLASPNQTTPILVTTALPDLNGTTPLIERLNASLLQSANQTNKIADLSDEWDNDFYITVAGITVCCLLAAAILRGIVFMWSSYRISSRLHAQMAKSALYTDLSYYNNNPSGSILNKFSKDLGSTDEMLPKAILDTSQTMSLVLGATINTLVVNYLFLFPTGLLVLVSILVRRYYMKTSTNLKRIENISRGPIYTHLNTCLHGLTTLRAQKAQKFLRTAFDFHQDLHTACLGTYVSCQQGYSFALDLLNFVYSTIVISVCIAGRGTLSGADIGLAITQAMVLTGMLQWGTRQSSEVVNMMTSVERLVTFTKLPPEDPDEATKKLAPENWPSKGAIKLENVSLTYTKDAPPALNDVSLDIHPSEKIGIVGRTGAGKSTLTSVLFRLARVEGKCIIDGTDTAELHLQSLRSSLAIIPQDPVLFSGDLRRNLDPFLKHPDHELWAALEDIDLTEITKDGHGLDSAISDCGNNLSVGQRQLICLARAVLKNRNIIVLDEATASVDPETDAQIQKTIRKRFAHCTVITIAHRLNTIMDCDRIIVMDAGRAVEMDTPHNLLQNEDGYFYSLVQETGPQMAARLTNQAYQNHFALLNNTGPNDEQRTKDDENAVS